MARWTLVLVIGTVLVGPWSLANAAQGPPADEWRLVDASAVGAPLVVTLVSGEDRRGRFRFATADTLAIDVAAGKGATETLTLRKAEIRQVAAPRGASLTTKVGGLAGAVTLAAFNVATFRACGIGCEAGESPLPLVGVGVGALIGAALGHASQKYSKAHGILYPIALAAPRERARFPADRPTVSLGASVATMSFEAAPIPGRTTTPRISVVWQAARHVTARVEYVRIGRTFAAPSGSVPASVLENRVPAPVNRAAGVPVGRENRRVGFILSELIGLNPAPFGRVRVEVLAGIGVVSHTDRDYYPQRQGTPPAPTGKYYALNFSTPEVGLVVGLDTEVAVARGLTLVPSVRHHRFDDGLTSTSFGIGAAWRLP